MTFLDAIAASSAAATTPVSRDCCVFCLDVLTRVYPGVALDRPDLRPLWMIHAEPDGTVLPERVWGPVAAVVAGIGMRFVQPVPGRWHIAQRWNGTPGSLVNGKKAAGHTFLFYCSGDGVGEIHESSRTRGPRSSPPGTAWPHEVGSVNVAIAVLRAP